MIRPAGGPTQGLVALCAYLVFLLPFISNIIFQTVRLTLELTCLICVAGDVVPRGGLLLLVPHSNDSQSGWDEDRQIRETHDSHRSLFGPLHSSSNIRHRLLLLRTGTSHRRIKWSIQAGSKD
jgi:hypothetical protein